MTWGFGWHAKKALSRGIAQKRFAGEHWGGVERHKPRKERLEILSQGEQWGEAAKRCSGIASSRRSSAENWALRRDRAAHQEILEKLKIARRCVVLSYAAGVVS
jgi:hypothetical protein